MHVTTLLSSGIPSLPVITAVKPGFESANVTVLLYPGHMSSFYLTISAFNQNEAPDVTEQFGLSVVSTDKMNYTVALTLPPGRYRFSVVASNAFGRTEESEMFPIIMNVEGRTICYSRWREWGGIGYH